MYTQFFQLKQAPFSIAPDPRYLFMSERHREALAHLLYGVTSGGGFVLLTGEIGAGKTTVCRCLLEQIPSQCRVAYIFNPKLSVVELLQSICDEFRIEAHCRRGAALSAKDYVDAINAYLLQSHADGQNNVLIIDEAQNLAPDVLEQLRLLTNLETSERKLLQIILIGQPELRTMLARADLEQLAQRVIARYHLDALSPKETAGYVQYRLAAAGLVTASPFCSKLMPKIHRLTRGIPRRINLLCDRALLGAYAAGKATVTPAIIDQAAREVFDQRAPAAARWPQRRQAMAAGMLAGTVLIAALAWSLGRHAGMAPADGLAPLWPGHTPFKLTRSLSDQSASAWRRDVGLGMPDRLAARSARPGALTGVANASTVVLSDLGDHFNDAMRDQAAAYRLLGQLWGIALKQGDACAAVKSRNVYCYRSTGGLAELRRLNRPAILSLHDGTNTVYYALLTGFTQTGAVLRVAGSRQDLMVDLNDLSKHFRGGFATFWRAPPGYRAELGLGDKGEDVDWLAVQLAKLNGGVEAAAGQPFNAAMAQQMRQFQSSHGLQADGVAGPQTLMLLNGAVGVREPRLTAGAMLAAAAPRK